MHAFQKGDKVRHRNERWVGEVHAVGPGTVSVEYQLDATLAAQLTERLNFRPPLRPGLRLDWFDESAFEAIE